MNADKMTLRVQNALNEAFNIAVSNNNQQLEPIHLLSALMVQEDGLIGSIIDKMGIDRTSIQNDIDDEVSKLPKVTGDGVNVTASVKINKILIEAEKISGEFKDSYISVEHLFLAMINLESSKGLSTSNVGKILKKYRIDKQSFLAVLHEIRGNQRVDSQDPEGTYDALLKYGTNLVKRAMNNKLDPVIGRDDEIRRAIRILSRRTKNNPVLIGEPVLVRQP